MAHMVSNIPTPKNRRDAYPEKLQAITCLRTMYKILTSIIIERIYNFLLKNNLLLAGQKECKRGSYRCKHQLIIIKTILEEVKTRKRNLSIAWIDYRNAFDSVPHSWIVMSLKICKVCPTTVKFIMESMKTGRLH